MQYISNMFRAVCIGVLASILIAAMPSAQAVEQTYSFSGTVESGAYTGENYSGSFSFDDAVGTGFAPMTGFSMSFLGQMFSLANAAANSPLDVTLSGGSIFGISYDFTGDALGFSLIAGVTDVSESFLAYDVYSGDQVVDGMSGTGNLIYAPVPEPQSYAMLLAGLGLLGFASRRWFKQS